MKDEKVIINIKKPENIPCKNCIWCGEIYGPNCAKFHQGKPKEVLYDGKPCPKQKKIYEDR